MKLDDAAVKVLRWPPPTMRATSALTSTSRQRFRHRRTPWRKGASRSRCTASWAAGDGDERTLPRRAAGRPQANAGPVCPAAPVAVDGAMPTQLSFPPHRLHAQQRPRRPAGPSVANSLARAPAGTLGGSAHIGDLGVVAGRDRLVLVSMSRGRAVEPTVAHAAALHTMPLLGRFLRCHEPWTPG